ncbi:MAG: hypothetical protein AUI14_15340 [Actinobacteria bacterium 13_2_20CM_2_71_6]|nr:MAG: hypothetical protein AUI14_15340 [Actinobacteria bacterium 13_2_20CM_2_71_6]
MCPDPRHAGSHVVRHGSSRALGRQRYRCTPAGERAHTFSLLLEFVDDAALLPTRMHLKSYRHSAVEIARALESIGRGATYRQAALQASVGRHDNGQLVANWVRDFGGIVAAPATPQSWPPVLGVGAFPLRPGTVGDAPVVQLAVGMTGAGAPTRLWAVRVAGHAGVHEWAAFYRRRAGAPTVLVVGSEVAARAARHWTWETPGGTATNAVDLEVLGRSLRAAREALFRRLAARQAHFSNRRQLDRLLDLMRLDLNGDADTAVYAGRILADGRAAGLPLQ